MTDSTRDRLLDAAYEALIEEGYGTVTVQGVARRAGLSNGAIYANFPTRHELLLEAVLRNWVRRVTPADLDEPARFLTRLMAAPATPEHTLLVEVTAATVRERDDSPLRTRVLRLAAKARSAIDRAKADGDVDADLATDALVALMVDLYLGTIIAKALGRRPPDEHELGEVLGRLGPLGRASPTSGGRLRP